MSYRISSEDGASLKGKNDFSFEIILTILQKKDIFKTEKLKMISLMTIKFPQKEQKRHQQLQKVALIFIIAVLLLAAVIVCLFLSGYLGLWVYGMSSIADNKQYEYVHNEVKGE